MADEGDGRDAPTAHSLSARGERWALWGERRVAWHALIRLLAVGVGVSTLLAEPSVSPQELLRTLGSDHETAERAPEVLLPTLGIRAPVVVAQSWDDREVRELFHRGVVLLPTDGWGDPHHRIITAHSSGDFSAGPYRFLFATIHRLRAGDTIELRLEGKPVTYRVREQRIVSPTAIRELPDVDRPTLTLVSCWPLGRNTHRVLVIAERVEGDGSIP